jgi:hypothetical protein
MPTGKEQAALTHLATNSATATTARTKKQVSRNQAGAAGRIGGLRCLALRGSKLDKGRGSMSGIRALSLVVQVCLFDACSTRGLQTGDPADEATVKACRSAIEEGLRSSEVGLYDRVDKVVCVGGWVWMEIVIVAG